MDDVTHRRCFYFIICLGTGTGCGCRNELTIELQPTNVTGKSVCGMTINGSIPGPTVGFTEGDTARIKVHNKMDVGTSIQLKRIRFSGR